MSQSIESIKGVQGSRPTDGWNDVARNGGVLGQAQARVEGTRESSSVWHPDRPHDAVDLAEIESENGALPLGSSWQPAVLNGNNMGLTPGMQVGAVYGRDTVHGVEPGMRAGGVYTSTF